MSENLSFVRTNSSLTPVTIGFNRSLLLGADSSRLNGSFSKLLSKAGFSVTRGRNGRSCFELAMMSEQFSRPFDLVLLDSRLPGLDGPSTALLLRQNGFCEPIVMIVDGRGRSEIEECLELGCNDCIQLADLEGRIFEILERIL